MTIRKIIFIIILSSPGWILYSRAQNSTDTKAPKADVKTAPTDKNATASPSLPPVGVSSDPNFPMPPEITVPQILPEPAKQPPAPLAAPNQDYSEGLSQRDPFRLPQYLLLKIKEKALKEKTEVVGIDDSQEPIRRWPLSAYQLVGILWDVKRPKAMFLDKQNTIHMLQLKDRIGNGGGVIASINNGEVVVIENKVPLRIRLKK